MQYLEILYYYKIHSFGLMMIYGLQGGEVRRIEGWHCSLRNALKAWITVRKLPKETTNQMNQISEHTQVRRIQCKSGVAPPEFPLSRLRVIAIGMQIPTRAGSVLHEQVGCVFERQKSSVKFPYIKGEIAPWKVQASWSWHLEFIFTLDIGRFCR